MKTEVVKCDIKGRRHDGPVTTYKLNVVFTTEQDEGRAVTAYLDSVQLEMCQTCYRRMIESRRLITAAGAMGHNTYTL